MIGILLFLLLTISVANQFKYYCATRGLLFYLSVKHGDMPDEVKLKELRDMAAKQSILEFFGKV